MLYVDLRGGRILILCAVVLNNMMNYCETLQAGGMWLHDYAMKIHNVT